MAPAVAWVLVIALSAVYAAVQLVRAAVADQGRAAHRPDGDRGAPHRRRGGRAGDRRSPSPTRTAASRTRRSLVGAPVPDLDLRPQPHALRPPHLRRRRQRRGGAARGHRRRPREDRRASRCARSWRWWAASCSPRACGRWTPTRAAARRCCTRSPRRSSAARRCSAAAARMKAAILGALVMLSIDNGLGLLGLSSGTKFVLTGGVLLLAVTVDSISRRGARPSRDEHDGRRCGAVGSRSPPPASTTRCSRARATADERRGGRGRLARPRARRGVRRRARDRARARLLRGAARRRRDRGGLHPAAELAARAVVDQGAGGRQARAVREAAHAPGRPRPRRRSTPPSRAAGC